MQANHTVENGDLVYLTTDYDQMLEWMASAENLGMFYSMRKIRGSKQDVMIQYPNVYPQLAIFGRSDDEPIDCYKFVINGNMMLSSDK